MRKYWEENIFWFALVGCIIALLAVGFILGRATKKCPEISEIPPVYKMEMQGDTLILSNDASCDSLMIWIREIRAYQKKGYSFLQYATQHPEKLRQSWCFYTIGVDNVYQLWYRVKEDFGGK